MYCSHCFGDFHFGDVLIILLVELEYGMGRAAAGLVLWKDQFFGIAAHL